jgi:hypothetical protein
MNNLGFCLAFVMFSYLASAAEAGKAQSKDTPPAVAPAASAPATRTRRWQEDLDLFAGELPARQKDFYQLMPKDKFEREVMDLKNGVPQLSDADIILRLMRLVAGLKVGHTSINAESGTGRQAFHNYPVQMQWFSDGLAVVEAKPEYREALGCRVVRLGTKTPEQVEASVAPYITYENSTRLRAKSAGAMELMELMRHEGIAGADGHLSLTCVRAGGGEFTLDLAPIDPAEPGREWVKAADALPIPTPLCRKRPDAAYWYEYLPAAQALYIQYNKCHDEPGNPFTNFTKQLFAFADTHPVQRVIVDLRFNGGGSSGIVKPLIDGLRSRPALSGQGHLYALMGGHTYSSATFAVKAFRADLHAILVGEPSGNKPNHYGQAESFMLPNSRLKVQYATKHFHMVKDGDPPAFYPDVPAAASLQDYLAGRDPVLDAALRHPLP